MNLTPETVARFFSYVDRNGPTIRPGLTPCWTWTGRLHSQGYGVFGRNTFAHRLAWELAYGPIPEGLCVLHRCDNRACLNAEHLFLGTRGDNAADRHAKNRDPHLPGERAPRAKLTNEQAEELRRVYHEEELTMREIGERYGLDSGSVSRVLNYQSYVPDGPLGARPADVGRIRSYRFDLPDEEIAALHDSGVSIVQIAARYKANWRTIKRHLDRQEKALPMAA